jgi:hypothetical protein
MEPHSRSHIEVQVCVMHPMQRQSIGTAWNITPLNSCLDLNAVSFGNRSMTPKATAVRRSFSESASDKTNSRLATSQTRHA